MRRHHANSGFTAIELMVVVAILAILAALAAPSFRPVMESWRVRSAVEEMTNTVHQARAEALRRGGNVVVLKLPNSASCSRATNDDEWGCGWQIFVDDNGNNTLDAGETLLMTAPEPRRVEVINQAGGVFFRIDRWGQASGLSALGFNFSPQDGSLSSAASRGLCISAGGRLRVTNNPPCP